MNGIDIRQVNFTCNDEVYLAMTGLFSLSELVALSMNSFSFSFRSSNLNTDLYLNLFSFGCVYMWGLMKGSLIKIVMLLKVQELCL